jgi:hypothetical protein
MPNILMRLTLLFLFVLLFTSTCVSMKNGTSPAERNDKLHPFQSSITEQQLRDHLFLLADDSLLGRGTGQPGIDMAADYLAARHAAIGMKAIGDDGTYFQNFNLTARVNDYISYNRFTVAGSDTQLVKNSRFEKGKPDAFYPVMGGELPVEGRVVYAGLGIRDESRGVDHLDADISGNWVLIFNDIPYVVDGDTLISPSITSRTRINQLLFREGVAGILMISHTDPDDFTGSAQIAANIFGNPVGVQLEYMQTGRGAPMQTAIFSLSPAEASDLLGIDQDALKSHYDALAADLSVFKPVMTDQ